MRFTRVHGEVSHIRRYDVTFEVDEDGQMIDISCSQKPYQWWCLKHCCRQVLQVEAAWTNYLVSSFMYTYVKVAEVVRAELMVKCRECTAKCFEVFR